jgi:amino acid permease
MSETKETVGVSNGYNSEKMMDNRSPSPRTSGDAESVTKSEPPDLRRKLKSRHLQMIAIGEWGKIWNVSITNAHTRG